MPRGVTKWGDSGVFLNTSTSNHIAEDPMGGSQNLYHLNSNGTHWEPFYNHGDTNSWSSML